MVRDELTGIPILSSVLDVVEREIEAKEQVGFLYFDVVQFHGFQERYGREVSNRLLKALGDTLVRQRGKLFREGDLVAIGGTGHDYFVIFLFAPPRRKERFAHSDLKLITYRVLQKLTHILNEQAAQMGVEEKIEFHSGSTIINRDPNIPTDRLVYEAQKEAALKSQLDEMMATFVSNVTHELRTPLTCIKGYAETLLEGALDEDTELARRWLQIICTEAHRLERLIHDLMDISMIEAQQVEFHFEPVSLPELVRHATDVLMPRARQAEIRLALDLPDGVPEITADRDRLSQVLLNLVDNAIKYSQPGGAVTARVESLPDYVAVEVIDQGTGIPDSELSRIFERFYRVEKGRSARYGGRGLGLAIARQIVEAHGGDLQVESELGTGSTFRLLLPLNGPWAEEEDEDEE